MYNQTKVQLGLIGLAVMFVLLGDRMVALATILTYALIDYISAKHYREAHAVYGLNSTLWWTSLAAYLYEKTKQEKRNDNGLPFATGVVRGLEIAGDTHFIVEIPANENPNAPRSVVLKREVELGTGENHIIPVYRVSPAGAAAVGKKVAKPARAEPVQKQLL